MIDAILMALLPEPLTLWSAIFLIVASFGTAAISATFGLGGGIAMLLALLLIVPPVIAIPVHGIIQTNSNAGRAWLMRKHVLPDLVWWFVPGAVAGIVMASLVVVALNQHTLQGILAIFILVSLWMPRPKVQALPLPWFCAVGALSSFCTLFVGATGPLIAVFLHPQRFGRDTTVGTHALCMTLQHLMKVVAFGLIGFVFTAWLPLLVIMSAAGYLGSMLGVKVLRSLPEETFRRLFKLVLTLLALRLLYVALLPA